MPMHPPPASTTMLQMVMRSSMFMPSTALPPNSIALYVAPLTLISPMICAQAKGCREQQRGRTGAGGVSLCGLLRLCSCPA